MIFHISASYKQSSADYTTSPFLSLLLPPAFRLKLIFLYSYFLQRLKSKVSEVRLYECLSESAVSKSSYQLRTHLSRQSVTLLS